MLLDNRNRTPQPGNYTPESWARQGHGRSIALFEQRYCDRAVSDIFGYYAVQIGMSDRSLLRRSPIDNVARLGLSNRCEIRADPRRFPFEQDSIDLVVMAHALENNSDPHQVLREVARALRPEGQVILFGFNPASLLGVRRLVDTCGEYPWHGDFISLTRMKDWLKLLDLSLVGGSFGCYAPPYTEPKTRRWVHWMEAAGDRWWPAFGGVYFLRARKRVYGMRLIKPNWRRTRHSQRVASATK